MRGVCGSAAHVDMFRETNNPTDRNNWFGGRGNAMCMVANSVWAVANTKVSHAKSVAGAVSEKSVAGEKCRRRGVAEKVSQRGGVAGAVSQVKSVGARPCRAWARESRGARQPGRARGAAESG